MSYRSFRNNVVLLLSVAVVCCSPVQGAEDLVRIALRERASVDHATITVGDVADLLGGPSSLRQRIAGLDLADVATVGSSVTISKRQIQFRLLLEDVDTDSFLLTAAEEVLASREVNREVLASHESQVIDVVREALAKHLRVIPSDLDIQLVSPIRELDLTQDIAADRLRLVADIPLTQKLGRARIPIRVYDGMELKGEISASIEAAAFMDIAIATRPITRGQELTPENLVNQRTRIDGPFQYVALEDATGHAVKRTVLQGEPIRVYDLTEVEPNEVENPIIVKVRDTVRVIARKGNLTVSLAAAQALEAGRKGELIRVKNLQSNRTIQGTVVGPSLLEVRF